MLPFHLLNLQIVCLIEAKIQGKFFVGFALSELSQLYLMILLKIKDIFQTSKLLINSFTTSKPIMLITSDLS